MAIEKMELVNIAGMVDDLNHTLFMCCQSSCFHIEHAVHSAEHSKNSLVTLNEQNPYALILKKLVGLSSNLKIEIQADKAVQNDDFSIDSIDNQLTKISDTYKSLKTKLRQLKQEYSEKEQALRQLTHLSGLTANFEQVFACEHIKVRVGKLPVDSYLKLDYYNESNFIFIKLDSNSNYVWGMYFMPRSAEAIVDDIFQSLYFERVRVPDFVKGTPEQAYQKLKDELAALKSQVDELSGRIDELKQQNIEYFNSIFSEIKTRYDVFELRKNVAVVNGKFYIVGFIPKDDCERFSSLFNNIDSVSVVLKPANVDPALTPPTKLKNGFFSTPFTMMVEMYGLPSYNGINPTLLFAISYTILFGAMFGDIGQGFVLFLLGLFLSKYKKMQAGGIVTRLGVSSMFFGFVYGSVFGFEELSILEHIYHAIGLKGKIIEVLAPESVNMILLSAIGAGLVLICIAIIMNIISGFREKNYEKALFGNNGIAGLVFFLSVVIGAALMMVKGIKVFTPLYITLFIVIPLLLMFFRVPLSNFVKYKKFHSDHEEKETIGTFIAENFFELFEFLLSYVTNTLSFLRVGGFIMSHAGMMLVVMTLAEQVSKGISPIIIVFGNLFVMVLEGMIVGIQVMRLEFYEIFSRFYEADGKPFSPVVVKLDTDIEN